MCLLRHLANGTAKVDINDADLVLFGQSFADLGHGFGVVIPDLDRQWTSFIGHPPQSIGMFGLVFIHPHEAPSVDHFSGQQPCAAKIANDLAKRSIRESRHRSLQNGRIDDEITDF